MLPLSKSDTENLRKRVRTLFVNEGTGDLLVRYILSGATKPDPKREHGVLCYQSGAFVERSRVVEDIYALITVARNDDETSDA